MKKVCSLFLTVALILGLTIPAFASGIVAPTATTLGYSVQSTKSNSGTVSTTAKDTMPVGDVFTVTFNKDSFNWSANGNGTYVAGNLGAGWLHFTGAASGQDFSVTGPVVDSITGNATFTLTALRAYSGTISMALNSGAGATNALQKAVTVSAATATITQTRTGGTAPVSTSHTGDINIKTGDKITYRVPANNFNWSTVGIQDASGLIDTSWVRLSGATLGKDFIATYATPVGSADVIVTLTAIKSGTFSSLSLSMLGGGGSVTLASAVQKVTVTETGSGGKITGIASDAALGGKGSGAKLNGKTISYNDLQSIDVKAGDEILLPLTAGFFTWDGTAPYAGSPVTSTQLRQGKIDVRSSSKNGSKVFASGSPDITNVNGQAHVRIKFTKDMTSTKDIDFSITLYMTVNKSRHSDSQLEIYGTLAQDSFEADGDDSYYDISDGSVIEATKFLRNVELYLGNGVTMRTNLLSGKRYSGTATNEISASDDDLLRKFPSIEEVVTIKTNTLRNGTNNVTIDTRGINYYVYNSKGEYLGRSNGKLDFSTKYYLSIKEIDMDLSGSESGNTGLPEDGTGLAPDIEPGDPTPPNINENPGTGR